MTDAAVAAGKLAPVATDQVPITIKVGWSIGALGYVTMMVIINVMFLYFLVGTLGIRPDVAGLLLSVIRLFDMVFDPAMGILSDSTRTRWGARRPWMFTSAFLSGGAIVAMFNVPELGSLTVPYLAAILVVFYIAYTMFAVPFLAMPADMTDSSEERTSLMSYKTVFTGVAGFVATGLAPFLVKEFGNTRAAFGEMALVIATIVTAAMLCSALSTGKARLAPARSQPQGLKNLTVLRQRNFILLLLVKLGALFGVSANASVGLLFQAYITERGPAGMAFLGTAQHIATIVAVPAWRLLLRRYQKRDVLIAALLLYGISCMSWLVSGVREPDWIFILRAIGLGTGFCGIVLVTTAMLPDCVQEDTERTGLNRGGTMSGFFAGVEKTAFALSPLAVGFILAAVGFTSFTGATIPQTDEAIHGIRLAASFMPASAVFVGAVVAYFYRYAPTNDLGRRVG